MKRVLIVVAAFGLAGCATQLEVVGPYASQLSQSDVQQITALITPDSSISHLYTRLEAVRPNEVQINYGGYRRSGGVYTSDPGNDYFTAYKRSGRWIAGNASGSERTYTVY
jgi:hypothetical protein